MKEHDNPSQSREITERIFTTGRRWSTFLIGIASLLTLMCGPLLIATPLAERIDPKGDGIASVVLLWIGIGLPVLLLTTVFPSFLYFIQQRLRQDVVDKVASQGVGPVLESGIFVGITPNEEVRSFAGVWDWDVGFLLIEPGRLRYYGDRASFALRPDQIRRIVIKPENGSGFFIPLRLLLYWSDPGTGLSGVLSITVAEVRSFRELRPKLEQLREQIERWSTEERASTEGRPSPLALPPDTTEEGAPVPLIYTSEGGLRSHFIAAAIWLPVSTLIGLGLKHWSNWEVISAWWWTFPNVIIINTIAESLEHRRVEREKERTTESIAETNSSGLGESGDYR